MVRGQRRSSGCIKPTAGLPPALIVVLWLVGGAGARAQNMQPCRVVMKRRLVSDYLTSTAYFDVVAAYGCLLFAEAVGDSGALRTVDSAYQRFVGSGYSPVEEIGSGDRNAAGILPLQLHHLFGNEEYLAFGYVFAEDEFEGVPDDSVSRYSRFWVDDMYTIGVLQAKAYEGIGEQRYADRCAYQLAAYIDVLQQPNGLFHHTANAPFFWGRGNGWAAAGLTEALLVLPGDHPRRGVLLEGYRKLAGGLLSVQDDNGMWHQVLDEPGSYVETSCSGMFVFALATGLARGWLSEAVFREPLEAAWQSLSGYVNDSGEVTNVCIGTMEGKRVEDYFDRPIEDGDPHGTAAFLWAGAAMAEPGSGDRGIVRRPVRSSPGRVGGRIPGALSFTPAGRILPLNSPRCMPGGWYVTTVSGKPGRAFLQGALGRR